MKTVKISEEKSNALKDIVQKARILLDECPNLYMETNGEDEDLDLAL